MLLLEDIPAWPGVAPVYSPAADTGAKLSPGGKVRQLDVATQQFSDWPPCPTLADGA